MNWKKIVKGLLVLLLVLGPAVRVEAVPIAQAEERLGNFTGPSSGTAQDDNVKASLDLLHSKVGGGVDNIGTGNAFYVDSNVASEGAGTSWIGAKDTLDEAVDLCTNNNGDVIYVAAGHNENWDTVDSADLDVIGITVIGLGTGTDRPRFDYDDTDPELVIGAANVRIYNLTFQPSVTAVVHAIEIEDDADGSIVDSCEFLTGEDAADEFIDAIQLALAADDIIISNNIATEWTAGANTWLDASTGIVDNLVVVNNRIWGVYAEGGIYSNKACTQTYVSGNVVTNHSTGVAAITFSGAATGTLRDNYAASDTPGTIIDPGSMEQSGNVEADYGAAEDADAAPSWAGVASGTGAYPINVEDDSLIAKILAMDNGGVATVADYSNATMSLEALNVDLDAILDDTGSAGVVLAADAITAAKIATNAIGATELAADCITSSEIATAAIDADAIGVAAIGESELAANCITASEIATSAIGALELATDCITTDELATACIDADAIAANAITSTKFASGAITAASIATDAIGALELGADCITSSEIADGAIDEGSIANWSLSANKFAAGAITANSIATDAIGAAELGTDCITSAEIANGAIDAGSIANYAIHSLALAANSITANNIATDAIGALELGADCITTSELATACIDADAIGVAAIGESELAADCITASEIATNAIGALELATDCITTEELASACIDADAIAPSAIGASEIADNAIDAGAFATAIKPPQMVIRNVADMTGYDTETWFTVTGDVLVRVVGVVGAAAITSGSGTTTISVGTTEDADAIIAATTLDNADFAISDVWVDNNPEDDCQVMGATEWFVVGTSSAIVVTRNVDDLDAGNLTLYCWWIPLSTNGLVTAAP